MQSIDNGDVVRAEAKYDGKELCEFLPRVKRQTIRKDPNRTTTPHTHETDVSNLPSPSDEDDDQEAIDGNNS